MASLYANNPNLAGAAVNITQTIAQAFAQSPSTMAMSQLNGTNIYVNPALFLQDGNGCQVAVILHELLHNTTGLTDPDLQKARSGFRRAIAVTIFIRITRRVLFPMMASIFVRLLCASLVDSSGPRALN